MQYQKIIIPSSLHPDTILGIFLLKKFGGGKYTGIETAELEIRQALPENETGASLKEKGVICLDLGGGEFDHHGKEKILSELVAADLGILQDSGLAKLLEYAKRDDKYGMGTISEDRIDRAFGLSGLISSLNKTLGHNEKVVTVLFPLLEAHYLEEKKRTSELPLEFESYLQQGKAEIFYVKQNKKKLKVVAIESDNASMPGWLRSSVGQKADVVCQRKSAGYTNILTKQFKRVDLRWLAAHVRREEQKLRGKVPYLLNDLLKPGSILEIPQWYYDTATNSLLNGGTNPGGIEATIIPFEKIKEILKEALAKSGHNNVNIRHAGHQNNPQSPQNFLGL